jgi:hypothetical protein
MTHHFLRIPVLEKKPLSLPPSHPPYLSLSHTHTGSYTSPLRKEGESSRREREEREQRESGRAGDRRERD